MAYDKHTWTCNEPITVERLNHIEDGIAAGGDCDCGFECEETITLLTNETVTTTAQGEVNGGSLSYSQFINAETIRVTFDGVEYDCPRIALSSNQNSYGGFNTATMMTDFSQYPFAILSTDGSGNEIATETAGTHTIKIETGEEIVTTTPCFDKARGYWCEEEIVTLTEESVTTTAQGGVNEGTLSYSQFIDADTIRVTFDGVEYDCPRLSDGTYGAPYNFSTDTFDWSEYPFQLYSYSSDGNSIITETAGTYTVKVEAIVLNPTMTPCFKSAVKSVIEEAVPPSDCESVTIYEATARLVSGVNALSVRNHKPQSEGLATIAIPEPYHTSRERICLQGWKVNTTAPNTAYEIKNIYYDDTNYCYNVEIYFTQAAIDYFFNITLDVITFKDTNYPSETINYLACSTSPK